ncbi:breast cancer type 2 susceptibility protein homolog [Euwallacea similis]|uniref:breast cancer type 2 susceptibility protein homolog n=1 Tax=Euwallacea similis TaxID=1736056 RepID=UPI00344E44C3
MDNSVSSQQEHLKVLSQEDRLPLSPVLGSGESIKKLLQNRRKQKRGKKKISQKLDQVFKSKTSIDSHGSLADSELNDTLDSLNETDFQLLADNVANPARITEHDDISERIKKLDALELERNKIINSISFQTPIPAKNQATKEAKFIETSKTANEDFQRHSPEIATYLEPLDVSNAVISGFQTCTGRSFTYTKEQIGKSTKLFDDILNPGKVVEARDKKFNYLHLNNVVVKKSEPSFTQANNSDEKPPQFESTEICKPVTELKHFSTAPKLSKNNLFENENFDDLVLEQFDGFQSASSSLSKYTNLDKKENPKFSLYQPKQQNEKFNQIKCSNEMNLKLSYQQTLLPDPIKPSVFFTAPLEVNNSKVFKPQQEMNKFQHSVPRKNQTKNIFDGENFDDLNIEHFGSFQSASNSVLNNKTPKPIHFLQTPIENILAGENSDKLKLSQPKNQSAPGLSFPERELNTCNSLTKNLNTRRFKKALNFATSPQVKKSFKNIFEDENFDDLNLVGIQRFTPSKLKPALSKGFAKFKSPFKTPIKSFSKPPQIRKSSDETFKGFSFEEKQSAIKVQTILDEVTNTIEQEFKTILSHKNAKMPLIKMNVISDILEHSQKRNFSEVDCHPSISSQGISRGIKRLGYAFSPSIQISETGLKKARLMFEDLEPKSNYTSTPVKLYREKPKNCNLTPIHTFGRSGRNVNFEASKSFSMDRTLKGVNDRFSLNKPSVGDVKEWLDELAHQRQVLEEKLRIVQERETILMNQRTMLHYSVEGRSRVLEGVLFKAKVAFQRLCLHDYVQGSFPGTNPSENNCLSQINPQNSHLVHFYDCDNSKSHIVTQDGAIVVPNKDSRIGVSEVEHSFKSLDSVDPDLIPKGWFQNHYKWIIWKLASYERAFEDKFEGCLCVENVMQQLKYRYDLEIDKAKRPILRKIFEKDDCSQRRMVLCVSKVIRKLNSYELELTDGWYPIRTIIDSPLCQQIAKGKIKIGTKLMIYGAELKNCDGCHPLEATDLIHLQINFNSTRRALWWCKLGSQRLSGPFMVPLDSVHLEGGKIGCISCFIVRVYPVKYLEKCGDKNVWRNKKAEERREQQFSSEKFNRSVGVDREADIKNVEDAAVLYDILQRSNNPESLQDILSSAQKTILYNYSIKKSSTASHSNIHSRNVSSLLKIKFVDAYRKSDKQYDFHIWRPSEGHFQELKEGFGLTIFNASCSLKWGLSASQSTQFKRQNVSGDYFEKFLRKVTLIGELSRQDASFNNEFDTAGFVVSKTIEEHCQEVWLADYNQKLLYVKISDSPKNILVLDTTAEGQMVSVCNLVMKNSCETHSYATADHFAVFARYSQYKHLQEALEILEESFKSIDKNRFIEECQSRIQKIKNKNASTSPTGSSYLDPDGMECSQITVTDIALLQCVEQFV